MTKHLVWIGIGLLALVLCWVAFDYWRYHRRMTGRAGVKPWVR